MAVVPAPTVDAGTDDLPTVHRLLDAAEALVAERGLAAVSVRAVNAAAGTNVAAVHYRFGSKEAPIVAVLRRRLALLGAVVDALLDTLSGALAAPVSTPHPDPAPGAPA